MCTVGVQGGMLGLPALPHHRKTCLDSFGLFLRSRWGSLRMNGDPETLFLVFAEQIS